jgi:hypothetical protein
MHSRNVYIERQTYADNMASFFVLKTVMLIFVADFEMSVSILMAGYKLLSS